MLKEQTEKVADRKRDNMKYSNMSSRSSKEQELADGKGSKKNGGWGGS